MEMYKDFLKETCGRDCYFNEKGFMTYYILNDMLCIDDLFIKKEFRGERLRMYFYKKAVNMAKNSNCSYISSVINKMSSKETMSRTRYILELEGFKEHNQDEYMIYFSKEI